MRLSLSLITHNRKNEILRAIKSAMPWITRDMEIVILDNQSNDGTQQLLETFLKDLDITYQYVYSEENLGVAGGRNRIFDLCRGEYVFTLDDDAIIETEDIFRKAIDFLDVHKDVAILNLDVSEPETGKHLHCSTKILDNTEYYLSFCYVGGAHVIRKSFFTSYGYLYPAKIKFGSEELYASLRVWQSGMKIVYTPMLKIHHLPVLNNPYSGKERTFNINLNIYIIKKLTYPRMTFPFVWLMTTLRMIKNGFWTKAWRSRYIKEIHIRYDISEAFKVSFRTLFFLAWTFKFIDVF